jgi:hypothetical protein
MNWQKKVKACFMLFVQMVFPARKKNRFASLFSDQRFLAKNMLRHSYDGAEAFVRKFFVRLDQAAFVR